MNFFKTGLQSVLGTSEVNEAATGAETVRKLENFASFSVLHRKIF
jgi:hypothetical protein